MKPNFEGGADEAQQASPQIGVEKGHQVTITRHGAPVAVLIPANRAVASTPCDTAVALRAFRNGKTLGVDVVALIAEGRDTSDKT